MVLAGAAFKRVSISAQRTTLALQNTRGGKRGRTFDMELSYTVTVIEGGTTESVAWLDGAR